MLRLRKQGNAFRIMRLRVAALPAGAAVGLLLIALSGNLAASTPTSTQTCDTSQYPLSTPTARFTDNGDGTVTDTQSRLMWLRCALGQTWSGKSCVGEPAALSWQQALERTATVNSGGQYFFSDWRLPQLPELASIAERQCRNPRINLSLFPGTPPAAYWSSTARPSNEVEPSLYVLSFGPEGVQYDNKQEQHLVRLVRSAF
jgi:hypothetical protein